MGRGRSTDDQAARSPAELAHLYGVGIREITKLCVRLGLGRVSAVQDLMPAQVQRVRAALDARPVKTAPMEVKVGQVKVVAVRSGVVVAQAVETMGAPSAVGGAVPAVMAGDLARLELRPPAPPPPPSLSAAEQSVLDADRKVTEKEDHRRRHPPKKYKRAKMRWKL